MTRMHSILAAVALLALVIVLVARGVSGADLERGRALYESRCGGCHAESVHGREKRVAADFDDVRRWVARWNETLPSRWGDEEIDDVTVFLNAAHYRYPCPPRYCKVVS